MRVNNKPSANKSLLNLNIGLIEQTSKSFKNYTPREANTENNPEKTLKSVSSHLDLFKKSPKDKFHTQFSKYQSTLGLNKSLNGVSSFTNISILSPSHKTQNQTQPKRPRILSKVKQSTSNTSLITQFKPLKVLGKGRFGNVSMVRHLPTGAIYAIKDISTQKMSAKLEQRLLAEIKIQSYLDHKNCLKLYKWFNEKKHLYLILELGQQSLFDILRKKRYLSQVETAYYLKQVIAALMYMHNQGVIHRDLKPENIIIVNGIAKLGDFGWAAYTPKETTFCGTLDYVSPQIVTGQYYDSMVDVWSVGVLCYELCTGQAPFESKKSRQQTYKKILTVDLLFPKHLSLLVKDFISKLLVKDPQKRMTLQEALQHKWMKMYDMEHQ